MDLENVFLNSAPDGGKWVTSSTFCFIFGETAHINHWVGGYLDSKASVDAVENILPSKTSKILSVSFLQNNS